MIVYAGTKFLGCLWTKPLVFSAAVGKFWEWVKTKQDKKKEKERKKVGDGGGVEGVTQAAGT